MTSARAIGLLTAAALFVASCAQTGNIQKIAPGERPSLETDEAGLWMQMDRVEESLKTSGKVVTDPDLNAYVRDILCQLDTGYCTDIRIYIVRAADFNASMAPNGVMIVWTGIVLRARNEAQLASVLGHELAHYIDRHSLKRWREIRNTTDAAVFFTFATGGIAGILAGFAAYDSIMSFSRDMEREADTRGLAMLRKAGYDPREAAKTWQQLVKEKEASDEPKRSAFFSTHPAAEERSETLAKKAEETDNSGTTVGRERHADITAPFRGYWLLDELRQRDYARFEVLLDQLTEVGSEDSQLLFYRGEMHRLRGEDEDPEKAIAAYDAAVESGSAPAKTYRSLGLVHWSAGNVAVARAAFETYLATQQDAEDQAMIEHYLQQMQ
ncbi:MAG: M48 family metalloprotease [Alphaproteobacteria bacterium]